MTKPAKPYPDFPLFPHATKRWAKKIKGRLHYFGPWSDPDAALKKYLDQRDDLQAGRAPRHPGDTRLTVQELCNLFLESKESRLASGELSQHMFNDYLRICRKLAIHFGRHQIVEDLRASDFEQLRAKFAKGTGLVTLGNRIQHTRIVFRYASESELIDKPIRFGTDFKRPSQRRLRAEKQLKPQKLFEAAQIRRLIAKAKQPLKAMIFLGINCGFGQTDCSMLPMKALDLDRGWIDFPRPKTAVPRRCPLWPETVAALREVLASRRPPKDERLIDRVFINRHGQEYVRLKPNGTNLDGVAAAFGKIRAELDLSGSHQGFYSLRHTFETIGGDTGDQVAVDLIMGHAPATTDMAAVYRKKVFDERLKKVVEHVRKWLWPSAIVAT